MNGNAALSGAPHFEVLFRYRIKIFQLGRDLTKSSFMKLVCAALHFALILCVNLINSCLS